MRANHSFRNFSFLVFPTIALCLLLLVGNASGQESTMMPSFPEPMTKTTNFRQEFSMGNKRAFQGTELLEFEALYTKMTNEYALVPPPEVDARIDTICKIQKQIFDDDGTISSTPDGDVLIVDYSMRYVSQHYNVTTYPRLFQNWTNSNLDTLLERMQETGLNVTAVDLAKRVIVSTPAPTVTHAPSTAPGRITPPPATNLPEEPVDSPPEEPVDSPGDDQAETPILESEPSGQNPSFYNNAALVAGCFVLAIGLF